MPIRHIEDGFSLGRWVSWQRVTYGNGRLSPERVAALEAVAGWTWDARASRWREHQLVLEQFVERHGHALVPAAHIEDGWPLGAWVVEQRQNRRRGTLAPDRAAELEKLAGWAWNTRPDTRPNR